MTRPDLATDLGHATLLLALLGLLAMRDCALLQPARAAGQEPPRTAQLERDREDLARCLVAEADAHSADYAPILSVLDARASRVGSTPAAVARRYCSALRTPRPTRRQALIVALPGGDGARGWRRAWAAALAAVDAFAAPVCGATHWGSRADGHPRAWVAVDCGPTVNLFYREPDRAGVVPAAMARGARR